jgi:hypothetical protein
MIVADMPSEKSSTGEVKIVQRRIVRIRRAPVCANDPKPAIPSPALVSFWHSGKDEGCLFWKHVSGGWYRVYANAETSMGATYGYVDPNVVYPKKQDEGRPKKRAVKPRSFWRRLFGL